jgi:hypothetical protein
MQQLQQYCQHSPLHWLLLRLELQANSWMAVSASSLQLVLTL